MITCAAFDAQIGAYLACGLTVREAEALESHAAECDRCGPILEVRGRLDVALPPELPVAGSHRAMVLSRVAMNRRDRKHSRWLIPTTIAAGLVMVFALATPGTKSAQRSGMSPSGQLATSRADAQFKELEAARAELTRALADAPDDPHLKSALSRLDAQRRALASLVKEFDS